MQENNFDYVNQLYEIFLKDPEAVGRDWRQYFQALSSPEINKSGIESNNIERERKQGLVKELVYAYRKLGHFHAKLDPLSLSSTPIIPELDIQYYGFSAEDLEKTFLPDHFGDGKPLTLRKLIENLKTIYCKTIGSEYFHINNQDEVRWIQNYLENPKYRESISLEKQKRVLACLTAAEGLEKYLGAKYVGQKRFSLEGGDSLIALLDTLVQQSGKLDVKEIVIGMAHRGRLNVLINILGKSPQELFDEFEGKYHDKNYSGDVKYHKGFSSDVKTEGGPVHLALAFNPSHLEIISPVAIGSVRARQQRRGLEKREEVLGIQIHGDAAFAGQGVVMETFSLSQTHGHGTAGTIHIVVNNQVGFTTDPINARSTYYCTDIAKMVQAPIFHVNADDPEAVLFITQLALEYRHTFSKDVVIDLICYRRHGHNEADEPAATQPIMYQKIRQQLTTRKIYADQLIQSGKITQQEVDQFIEEYRNNLDKKLNPLTPLLKNFSNPFSIDWTPYLDQSFDEKVNTSVKLEVLKQLGTQINSLPEGMVLQPQVAKVIEDNRKMSKGEIPLNWGFAENLAYATLLNEGFDIRLTGQDSGRGTFAHRHAVLHDYQNGNIFIPLKTISEKADVTITDSILSEVAVLAFEYGYAASMPNALVLWEAQFGDFANGAQVVIDQFISSGEQKWKRLCGLVMLLPHGYEGMGPEHSSARLERFLQLCAQDNMQVCVPTTPAQIFHLLRRQILRKARKPLIVMTPKSLLRHKLAVSQLEELRKGEYQLIIPESDDLKVNDITRVIFCSGKIYYELLEARRSQKLNNIALIRIEQLYPTPISAIENILKTYKKAKEVVWCQEEPQNQGAWFFIKSQIESCLVNSQALRYIGPPVAAATAIGSSKLHVKLQQELISEALKGNAK
jgi:2-oxoglutarate dehydrogenase E1 component